MMGHDARVPCSSRVWGPVGRASGTAPTSWTWKVRARMGPVAQFSKAGPDTQYSQTEACTHPPRSNQHLTVTLQQTTAVATLRAQPQKTSSNRMQCWKYDLINEPGKGRLQQTEPTSPAWKELNVMVTKWQTKPQVNKTPTHSAFQNSNTAACWLAVHSNLY